MGWKKSFKEWCIENNRLDLLEQFKPELNKGLQPDKVYWKLTKLIMWKCNCGNTWREEMNKRTVENTKCPKCVPIIVVKRGNLIETHPDLCKDWNYSKNNTIPENYTKGQHIEVNWKCHRCGHEWPSRIDWRASKGRGCPNCDKGRQTSYPEQVVYWWIKQSIQSAQNRFMLNKVEYDIFIPHIKLAIEYDGFDTHKDKEAKHLEKLQVAKASGVYLLNIVETKPSDKSPMQRYTKGHQLLEYEIKGNYSNIGELIHNLDQLLALFFRVKLKPLTKGILIKAKEESQKRCTTENSLAENHPELVIFYDYNKNNLPPEEVSRSSGEPVHWECPVCHEEYYKSPHYMVSRFTACKCGLNVHSFEGYLEEMRSTGAKVKEANVFGQTLYETSFIKILESTLLMMYYKDNNILQSLTNSKSFAKTTKDKKLKYIISSDKTIYTQPKQIGNTGLYFEGKINSKDAFNILKQLIEICGYQHKIYVKI